MALKGNRGFAGVIAGGAGEGGSTRLPPRTGILAARDNRLASLTSGSSTTRVHEAVDPARCRIWAGHNRDYGALDEVGCADLLESLKAQGRQEVPAIVRRVAGDPAHDYEVVCGARRHWSVTWLRAHDHPEFRFVVEPRELTDEEAFRVADLENRSRKDLSDYERASDYARAVDTYYGGSQQRMAERMQVSRSWLSRYLELAKLPDEVQAAFGSPHALGISHAGRLAPLLRAPVTRILVLERAVRLAVEQQERKAAGQGWLSPAIITSRLVGTATPNRKPPQCTDVKDARGRVVARAERGRGGITITITKLGKLDDMIDTVRTMLRTLTA